MVHAEGNVSKRADWTHGCAHAGTARVSATGSPVADGEVVGFCGVAVITEGNVMHSLLMWLRSIVVVQNLGVVSALLQ